MSRFLSAAQERFVYGKLRQASRMDYGKRRMGTKLKERLYIISVIRSVSRCSYHDPYTTSMSLTQPHVNDVTRNLEQSSMSMGLIGINQDPQRRATLARRHSSTDIRAIHQCIMDDLRELYCCRPDPSIFQRSWRLDAEFEVNFIPSARLELTLVRLTEPRL